MLGGRFARAGMRGMEAERGAPQPAAGRMGAPFFGLFLFSLFFDLIQVCWGIMPCRAVPGIPPVRPASGLLCGLPDTAWGGAKVGVALCPVAEALSESTGANAPRFPPGQRPRPCPGPGRAGPTGSGCSGPGHRPNLDLGVGSAPACHSSGQTLPRHLRNVGEGRGELREGGAWGLGSWSLPSWAQAQWAKEGPKGSSGARLLGDPWKAPAHSGYRRCRGSAGGVWRAGTQLKG